MLKLAEGHGLDWDKLLILEAETAEECTQEARRISGKDGVLHPGALVKSPEGNLFVVVRPDVGGRYDIARVEAEVGSEAEVTMLCGQPLDKFAVVRR